MKNFFRNRYLLAVIFIGGMVAIAATYQNCGSSNSSVSAFNLTSGVSGALALTNINLGQATYPANVSMTGSATVTNGTDPLNCQWVIMLGQSLINTFNSVSSQSVCSLPSTAVAPSAAGAYTLTLTATKGSSQGSASIGFSVQGGSTATPTPTATPTATPPPSPTPTPTPPPMPAYYCSCNTGTQPVCAGANLAGQACYFNETWNCNFCPTHCSTSPYTCD